MMNRMNRVNIYNESYKNELYKHTLFKCIAQYFVFKVTLFLQGRQ